MVRLESKFHAAARAIAICCGVVEAVEHFKDSLFEDFRGQYTCTNKKFSSNGKG